MNKLNTTEFLPWLLAALVVAMFIVFGKIIMQESPTATTDPMTIQQTSQTWNCEKVVRYVRPDSVVDVLGHTCWKQ